MSFVEKLKQRTAAVGTAVKKNVVRRIASTEVISTRLEICNSCEHLFKPTNQCTQCGCFIEAKVRLKGSSCPIDKWSREVDEETKSN